MGNRGTILRLPSLYSVSVQLQGIGRIALLQAILSTFYQKMETTGRSVDTEVIDFLQPTFTLGYVLPAATAPTQTPNNKAWQHSRRTFSVHR